MPSGLHSWLSFYLLNADVYRMSHVWVKNSKIQIVLYHDLQVRMGLGWSWLSRGQSVGYGLRQSSAFCWVIFWTLREGVSVYSVSDC